MNESKIRIVAILQARMSSSRLPGKVLEPILGQPMLGRVVGRARRARLIQEVVVATSQDPSDDPVAAFCQQSGIPFTRGSMHDVLDRYYQAALRFQAEVIVRLTADCPLLDPGLVDATVHAFLGRPVQMSGLRLSLAGRANGEKIPYRPAANPTGFAADFAANRLPPPWRRTFPIGLDTEVCSFQALERAWQEADQPYQREHVMPYLYNQAGRPPERRFRVLLLDHEPDYGALRWTVDTPQDLEMVRQVYAHLGEREDFSWYDVLDLLAQRPELAQINAQVHHKSAFDVDERAKSE